MNVENYAEWTSCEVHGHRWASEIDFETQYPDYCIDCGETRPR